MTAKKRKRDENVFLLPKNFISCRALLIKSLKF